MATALVASGSARLLWSLWLYGRSPDPASPPHRCSGTWRLRCAWWWLCLLCCLRGLGKEHSESEWHRCGASIGRLRRWDGSCPASRLLASGGPPSSSLALRVCDEDASADESPRDDGAGETPRLAAGAGEGLSSAVRDDTTPHASNSRLAGSLLARSKSQAESSSAGAGPSSSESNGSRTPLRFSRDEGAPPPSWSDESCSGVANGAGLVAGVSHAVCRAAGRVLLGRVGGGLASPAVSEVALEEARLAELSSESAGPSSASAARAPPTSSRCLACFHEEEFISSALATTSRARERSRGLWWWWWRLGPFCFGGNGGG